VSVSIKLDSFIKMGGTAEANFRPLLYYITGDGSFFIATKVGNL